MIDEAMMAIEKENLRLEGVLPIQYVHLGFDKQRLGELIDLISKDWTEGRKQFKRYAGTSI